MNRTLQVDLRIVGADDKSYLARLFFKKETVDSLISAHQCWTSDSSEGSPYLDLECDIGFLHRDYLRSSADYVSHDPWDNRGLKSSHYFKRTVDGSSEFVFNFGNRRTEAGIYMSGPVADQGIPISIFEAFQRGESNISFDGLVIHIANEPQVPLTYVSQDDANKTVYFRTIDQAHDYQVTISGGSSLKLSVLGPGRKPVSDVDDIGRFLLDTQKVSFDSMSADLRSALMAVVNG